MKYTFIYQSNLQLITMGNSLVQCANSVITTTYCQPFYKFSQLDISTGVIPNRERKPTSYCVRYGENGEKLVAVKSRQGDTRDIQLIPIFQEVSHQYLQF